MLVNKYPPENLKKTHMIVIYIFSFLFPILFMKTLIISFNFKYYLPTVAVMAIIVGSLKVLRNYNYLDYWWDIFSAYLLFIVLFTLTISFLKTTYYTHIFIAITTIVLILVVLSAIKFTLVKNKIKTKTFIKYEIPIYICVLTGIILIFT